MMVAVFLFIVITINIGNIAQEKTGISNASDGTALILSSMLGSLANALRINFGIYHGDEKQCDPDLWLFFEIIAAVLATIAAVALTIVTVGATSPGLIAIAGMWVAIAGAAASLGLAGFGMYNALVAEPGAFRQAELKFKSMTLEQRMKERAMQYALFAVISDPNKLCADRTCGDPEERGGCADPTDIDMDGDTDDCVHCFSKWYNDRVSALPRVGEIVEILFKEIFDAGESFSSAPRIYVWEDPEKWKVVKEGKEYECGFWTDAKNNGVVDPKAGTSSIPFQGSLRLSLTFLGDIKEEDGSNEEHDPLGVNYYHDIYFSDWLDRFSVLAQKLSEFGYGIDENYWVTKSKIDNLKESIKDFQNDLSNLYGTSYESRVEAFDQWFEMFYNGGNPKEEDWYKNMQEWLNIVGSLDTPGSWIYILKQRRDQINSDLDACWAKGPWVCGAGGWDGPCCQSHNRICYGEYGAYICGCDCDNWCGCAGGAGGGKFCPSSSPCGRPQVMANTPTGGPRNCCDSAYKVHYQLCDPGRYCTGGGGPCDGPCCDTYHNCGVDHALNIITREHAIEYLNKFANDVRALMNAFKTAYDEKIKAENDTRFNEVFYAWTDKVAKKGPAEQPIRHIVYVKLGDFKSYTDNKLDPEYKYPHALPSREWEFGWWTFLLPIPMPKKCVSVVSDKGNFTVTVARYDEDVGTLASSPLKNLWTFKTRGPSTSSVFPSITKKTAPYDTDPAAIPQSDYETAIDFVLANGIVSKTEGHYGPGETYTKEEIEQLETKASKRNRDIYIKRLQ